MPKFRYAKLVRDNIPQLHIGCAHIVDGKQLKGKELHDALYQKLHEEADEVKAALHHEELVEELADVQQIVNDICKLNDITRLELDAAMEKKFDRKGGFINGEYIETVTMPDDNDEWAEYCRKSPEKYPEVK